MLCSAFKKLDFLKGQWHFAKFCTQILISILNSIRIHQNLIFAMCLSFIQWEGENIFKFIQRMAEFIHRRKVEDADRIKMMKIILVFSSNFKYLSGSVQADCHHRRNSWGWVWSWWKSRFIIDERPKKLEWFF